MTFQFESQASSTTEADLNRLREVLGKDLPTLYDELLKFSHGGEWLLPVEPFTFSMFRVEQVIGNPTGTDFAECYPGLLPIGGDGMGVYRHWSGKR